MHVLLGQGLATVTDFGDTNEEAARDYYRRLAIGQVWNKEVR